ncbi:MAG: LPS assembly lipoprotein LptE [Campylobacterales bacterium]
MRFLIPLLLLFFIGCGYKPSSEFTRASLGGSVYVQVEINAEEATTIPYIKDSMIEAVIRRFHSRVKSEDMADTVMFMRLSSVSFTPVSYDSNGFVVAYRANVDISIRYKKKNGAYKIYNAQGIHDFTIQPDSVISDTSREKAIKIGTDRAIDSFISYLSAKGILK